MERDARPQPNHSDSPATGWHEIYAEDGSPRPIFRKALRDLSGLNAPELRALDDGMEATLREMGVTFDVMRNDPWGRPPWTCDLLPHVFASSYIIYYKAKYTFNKTYN